MNVFELAKKYYPLLWPIERLDALLAAGKLTHEEYIQITKGGTENGQYKDN